MPTTLDDVAWPVPTERLTIRRATPDDAKPTWRWRQLPETYAWTTHAESDFESYQERFLDEGRLAATLVVEHDGEMIGDLMLKLEDAWAQDAPRPEAQNAQAELGWTLDPAQQGHGYATEAVRGLIDLCFTQLGLRRVTAACFAANEASWRLMERLGMRREAHWVKESLHRSGEWLDAFHYGLLAEEWQARD